MKTANAEECATSWYRTCGRGELLRESEVRGSGDGYECQDKQKILADDGKDSDEYGDLL